MAIYSLSGKVASDLDAIYEYTILRFGLEQARVYLLGMEKQFQILAEQPAHGRQADALARGLRRWEYQSPIIFTCLRNTVFGSSVYCTSAWMSGDMCNCRVDPKSEENTSLSSAFVSLSRNVRYRMRFSTVARTSW